MAALDTVNPVKRGIRFSTVCILVLLLFKIAFSAVIKDESEAIDNILFAVFSVWMLVYFLGNMIIQHVSLVRLNKYFVEHHKEKAEWFNTVPFLGSGPMMHNHARSWPFLFSNDDLGDPIVGKMKVIARNSLAYSFCVFFSIPFLAIAFLVL